MSTSQDSETPAPVAVPRVVVDFALRSWAKAGRHTTFTVAGVSMLPFLVAGDEVLITHGWSGIRPGEIVAYRQGDTLVVHRLLSVIGRAERILLLRGDNCVYPDPLIPAGQVIGRATGVRRGARYLRLDTPAMRLTSILIAAFARWPIILDHLARRAWVAGWPGPRPGPLRRAVLALFALPGRMLSRLAWQLAP